MELKKGLILLYGLSIFCTGVYAQQKTGPKYAHHTTTIYHYSFVGANSLLQVDSLASEIYSQLPEVKQFKAKFKPENKHAEITLVVVEYFPYPEAPNTFSAVKLKTIIIRHGYDPLALTEHIQEN